MRTPVKQQTTRHCRNARVTCRSFNEGVKSLSFYKTTIIDPSLASPCLKFWQHCGVSAVALLQVATLTGAGTCTLSLPALASTTDFTIETRDSERNGEEDYFQTVPQGLTSSDEEPKGPRLGSLLEGPRGREVQQCARKCVPTCIRGGQGAPGLGPMSVRKEIVVFKEGYRTRQYCLSECIQVCNLTIKPNKPSN